MLEGLLLSIGAIFGANLLLLIWCWRIVLPRERRWMTERSTGQRAQCLVVLGSGGHTAEMLYDLATLAPWRNQLAMKYLVAETDRSSQAKAEAFEAKYGTAWTRVVRVPRAREVGQSYLSSILTSLVALWYSVLAVFTDPPDVVITNGPGTCVPVVLAAYAARALCFRNVRVIYSESFACVDHLSLSGRLLYRLADHFTVQWPQLLEQHPRARYAGRLYSSDQVESARRGGQDLPPAELPALSPAQGAQATPTAIVTVGSTKFDSLIRAIDCQDFLVLLQGMGIKRLTVQKGNGEYRPANLGEPGKPALPGLEVEILEYSQDLPERLRDAALVISHAGAGTILDCLQAGRRMIVVPNEELMNNHQVQLGLALQEQGLLFCFKAGVLLQSLKEADFSSLRSFPPHSNPLFARLVCCEMLGLENVVKSASTQPMRPA